MFFPYDTIFTNRRHACIFLFVLILLTYATTLQNGFVLDDVIIREGNYPEHLGESIYLLWEPVPHGLMQHYRPLTFFSFTIDHMLWGDNPFGFHLTNIILAALAVMFAYLFLQVFLTSAQALIAATVFAALPGHSEVIIGIYNRSQVLAAIFLFAALWSFCRGLEKENDYLKWLCLSGFCTLLSCWSKEIGFLLPLLSLPWLFLANNRKIVCLGIGIQGMACLCYLILRFQALGAFSFNEVEGFLVGRTISEKYFTICYTLWMYLKLSCFPTDLSCDYPTEVLDFSFAGIFIPIMGAGLIIWLRQNKTVLYFGYWFVVLLLPALHFIPIQISFAERLLYPASLAIGVWFSLLVEPRKNGKKVWLTILALCMILVTMNCWNWRSNLTLWTNAFQVNPSSYRALTFMGNQEARQGNIAKAEELFHQALASKPNKMNRALIYWNLTLIHSGQKSASYFQKLINIYPWYPPAVITLGNHYYQKQNWSLALQYFQHAPQPRNRWDKKYLAIQEKIKELEKRIRK